MGNEMGGWEGRGGGEEETRETALFISQTTQVSRSPTEHFPKTSQRVCLENERSCSAEWVAKYKYRLENIHNVALAEKVFIFLFK